MRPDARSVILRVTGQNYDLDPRRRFLQKFAKPRHPALIGLRQLIVQNDEGTQRFSDGDPK